MNRSATQTPDNGGSPSGVNDRAAGAVMGALIGDALGIAPDPPRAGRFSSPDALLTPSCTAEAALDPGITIEPAWKVSIVYGMPRAIFHQLPAAYYLAARFAGDFESAVLHALNGGGQNQARCILTGALVGAQVGLSRIPRRFLDGLEKSSELTSLSRELGRQAER
jgi:hypothetical protein